MAKLFKDVTNAVGSVLGASIKVIDSTANTFVAISENTGRPIVNTLETAGNYSEEFKLDSEFSLKKSQMVNASKVKALESALADEEVMAQIQSATSKAIVADIFEELDIAQ